MCGFFSSIYIKHHKAYAFLAKYALNFPVFFILTHFAANLNIKIGFQ